MAVNAPSSGTKTADATEQTLATVSVAGLYQLNVDASALANGDTLILRAKIKTLSAGTSRLLAESVFVNALSLPSIQFPTTPIAVTQEVVFTLNGPNTKDFPWAAIRIDFLDVNATQISGDSTAADNAEAFFDGTGYAGTGNVIPTVTSVTNEVTANMTKISGDAVAADNLEAAADGTGFNLGGGAVVAASVTAGVTLAANSWDSTAVADSGKAEIADAILDRSLAGGANATGVNARSIRNALRALRNKNSVSGTTLTVTEEDDATTAFTATITGTPAVTGFDPA